MDVPTSATATIRHVTAHTASLELSSEQPGDPNFTPQTLEWPRELLPAHLSEGDTVTVQVLAEGQLEAQSQQQARILLSELLGNRS